jgi:hypothetical protein
MEAHGSFRGGIGYTPGADQVAAGNPYFFERGLELRIIEQGDLNGGLRGERLRERLLRRLLGFTFTAEVRPVHRVACPADDHFVHVLERAVLRDAAC